MVITTEKVLYFSGADVPESSGGPGVPAEPGTGRDRSHQAGKGRGQFTLRWPVCPGVLSAETRNVR